MTLEELEAELSRLRDTFHQMCRNNPNICPHDLMVNQISNPFTSNGKLYQVVTYKCSICGKEIKDMQEIVWGINMAENKKYYIVSIETWSYDWERIDHYFFRDKDAAEQEKEKILSQLVNTNKRGSIEEITFNELKERITVAEYEKLMKVRISEPWKW